MPSCSVHHCVLFLLTLTFTTAAPDISTVTVKQNEAALLPCKWNCLGLSTWTVSGKQDPVGWCNQTSCWSDEGFNISHDDYLKGNLALIVTAADYSKRGWYTCQCEEDDIHLVRLSIDTLMSSVQLNRGERLILALSVTQPVKVMYKSKDSADPYGEQICNVTQDVVKCKAEYTPRVSLNGTDLTISNANVLDGGVYLVQDNTSNEVIHVYTVHVGDFEHREVVTVKLYEPATLVCEYKCLGVVKWIHNRTVRWAYHNIDEDVVAQCNQTMCWAEEQYVMSHDQYMNGTLSLNITSTDYRKRGWYTCMCGNPLRSWQLKIETFRTSFDLKSGENLLMKLPRMENIEVIYNQSVIYEPTSKQICTLKKGSLDCQDEYTQRLERVLKLKVNQTDSGVYTIRDTETNEDIHIYNVTVTGDQPGSGNCLRFSPLWFGCVVVGVIVVQI